MSPAADGRRLRQRSRRQRALQPSACRCVAAPPRTATQPNRCPPHGPHARRGAAVVAVVFARAIAAISHSIACTLCHVCIQLHTQPLHPRALSQPPSASRSLPSAGTVAVRFVRPLFLMSDGTLDSARCLSCAIDASDAHRTSSALGSGAARAQSRHGQADRVSLWVSVNGRPDLAPFREFPAFGHSAAAVTIESRDSLIDVQGRAGLADRSALPASFCQAVPPLLCDCSQSTAQRELLSPPPCPPSFPFPFLSLTPLSPSIPFPSPFTASPLAPPAFSLFRVTARHVPWVSLPGSFVVTLRPSGSSHSSFCLHTSGRWTSHSQS